ncbi:MAG: UpxY family transcription antiterminator [Gemmatimonadales bacterium]
MIAGAPKAPDAYHTCRWYACRTRPRAEKRAGQLLRLRGVESYVPLLERERQWSDRTKRVGFPLFPGYVFAQFSLAMVHDVLGTPGVVTIVRNDGNLAPVRVEELESIRVLVSYVNAGNAPPEPAEFLETGQEVIVAHGPFSGIRGVLVEDRGRARVVIRLTALRKALSVELPREMLRAAAG